MFSPWWQTSLVFVLQALKCRALTYMSPWAHPTLYYLHKIDFDSVINLVTSSYEEEHVACVSHVSKCHELSKRDIDKWKCCRLAPNPIKQIFQHVNLCVTSYLVVVISPCIFLNLALQLSNSAKSLNAPPTWRHHNKYQMKRGRPHHFKHES